MPTEISQGQRKLVSAARALAARPQLVCMDEPAAGLDTHESQELGRRLREIIDAGITIFLVDHDMGLVLNVCDYIYVIEFGATIAEGTPEEIKRDPRVIEAYLGSSAGGARGMTRRRCSRSTNLYTGYNDVPVVRDLNLHVDAGRDRRAARPERRGQDHDAAHDVGAEPDHQGRHHGVRHARSRVGARTSSPATASPTCSRTARCSSS